LNLFDLKVEAAAMATDYQQQVFPLFVPATNTVDKNELIQMIKEVDPLTKDCSHGVEAREKAELKRRYGFKQPQALLGYSKDAKYKDLCVYFDLVDRKSAINEHISNVFSCYGVTGQTGAPHTVRGNAIVLRSEPPKMGHIGQMHFPFNPHIPIEEMVGTILFFRGKDVRALAHLRDAARYDQRRCDYARGYDYASSSCAGILDLLLVCVVS
jgi:hypothetical protein